MHQRWSHPKASAYVLMNLLFLIHYRKILDLVLRNLILVKIYLFLRQEIRLI